MKGDIGLTDQPSPPESKGGQVMEGRREGGTQPADIQSNSSNPDSTYTLYIYSHLYHLDLLHPYSYHSFHLRPYDVYLALSLFPGLSRSPSIRRFRSPGLGDDISPGFHFTSQDSHTSLTGSLPHSQDSDIPRHNNQDSFQLRSQLRFKVR